MHDILIHDTATEFHACIIISVMDRERVLGS